MQGSRLNEHSVKYLQIIHEIYHYINNKNWTHDLIESRHSITFSFNILNFLCKGFLFLLKKSIDLFI